MNDAVARIVSIYRYPVKGFTPEPMDEVKLTAGEIFPGDRQFAVEVGSRDFDPVEPAYFPKTKFLQLMTYEKVASLECRFDQDTSMLTLKRDGKQVARGNLALPVGRQMIEQFLSAYLHGDLRGPPRIVSAGGHHFTDIPMKAVSLINLASLREMERVIGKPVDPLRFRANIYVDGLPPWEEFKWLDKTLAVDGEPAFDVIDRTVRCAATNVDPQTAQRDMQIPRVLSDVFGHGDCGMYMKTASDITLRPGMTLLPAD